MKPWEHYKKADSGPTPKSEVRNFGEGANKAIAEVIGAPVDAANFLLSQVGLGSDRPIGGSESIKTLFDDIGVGATPDSGSLAGRIGEEVGAGATMFAPLGTLARAGRSGGVFKPMVDYIRSKPMRAILADLGLSAVSGSGAYVGREVIEAGVGERYAPLGDMFGGLVGGMVPAAAVGAVRGAARGTSTALGLTDKARRRHAADTLRANMQPSSEGRLAYARRPRYGRPSTGELLDDAGLISLERAQARRTSELVRAEQQKSLRGGIRDALPSMGGNKAEAVGHFERRVATAVSNVEGHLSRALNNVRARTQMIDPNEPVDVIQKAARVELDKSLKLARQEERKLWGQIGTDDFDMAPIREAAEELVSAQMKADKARGNLHPLIYKIAGVKDPDVMPATLFDENGVEIAADDIIKSSLYGDVESLDEINALRSNLLEILRAENAAGRWERARNIRAMVTASNDVLPVGGGPNAGMMTRRARDFSKSLNDAYTRGPIGAILGYDAKGGVRVPPEMTLEKLIRPGTEGRLGTEALLQSAEAYGKNVDEVSNYVQDFLRAMFTSATIDQTTGQFSEAAARSFVNKYDRTLDLFPNLKTALVDVRTAERTARSVDKRVARRIKKIRDTSYAARYTRGDTPKQAESIFTADDPVKAARSLVASAKKDPTGKALDGVRESVFDVVMDRIAPDVRADMPGKAPAVQGKRIRALLKPPYRVVLQEVYGDHAIRVLEEVSKGANMVERLGKGVAVGGGSDTARNLRNVAGSIGVIIGSKLGGHAGTHELLAAGIGRRVMAGIISRVMGAQTDDVVHMVERALYDPNFANVLLTSTLRVEKEGILAPKYAVFMDLLKEGERQTGAAAVAGSPTPLDTLTGRVIKEMKQ